MRTNSFHWVCYHLGPSEDCKRLRTICLMVCYTTIRFRQQRQKGTLEQRTLSDTVKVHERKRGSPAEPRSCPFYLQGFVFQRLARLKCFLPSYLYTSRKVFVHTVIILGYCLSTSSTFADMSGPSDMDEPALENQIMHRVVESHFPLGCKKIYMPANRLREVITRSSIIREFSRDLDPKEQLQLDENLISFILTSASKLLAITLITGIQSSRLHRTMRIFQKYLFTDDQLPVLSEDNIFPWSDLKWGDLEQRIFKEVQWYFLVRVFKKKEFIMELGGREILPFRLVNQRSQGGTFSEVLEVAIQEAHQEQPMRMVSPRLGSLDLGLTGYRWTAVAGLPTQRSKLTRTQVGSELMSTANGPR